MGEIDGLEDTSTNYTTHKGKGKFKGSGKGKGERASSVIPGFRWKDQQEKDAVFLHAMRIYLSTERLPSR